MIEERMQRLQKILDPKSSDSISVLIDKCVHAMGEVMEITSYIAESQFMFVELEDADHSVRICLCADIYEVEWVKQTTSKIVSREIKYL